MSGDEGLLDTSVVILLDRLAGPSGDGPLLAATAIANDLPIHTVNPRDFEGIDGLDARPVTHPDAG